MANGDRAAQLAADIDARFDPAADPRVTPALVALYRSLPRVALATLQAAFTLDRQETDATPAQIAFCQSRIDLITQLLTAPRLAPRRVGRAPTGPTGRSR